MNVAVQFNHSLLSLRKPLKEARFLFGIDEESPMAQGPWLPIFFFHFPQGLQLYVIALFSGFIVVF